MNTQSLSLSSSIIIVGKSREEVWERVTQTGIPQAFFLGGAICGSIGVDLKFKLRHQRRRSVVAIGRTIALVPGEQWAHAFEFDFLDEPETRVTWNWADTINGTQVSLVHDQLANSMTTYRICMRLWPTVLAYLCACLEPRKLTKRERLDAFGLNAYLGAKLGLQDYFLSYMDG